MSKYPPLPVFNEDDEQIGEAMLEEILDKQLLHRVVHIIVEDDEGRTLLQLRGPNVKTDPNCWGFSTEGYVDLGENYEQAAKRELEEELGLKNIKLKSLGVFREYEEVGRYKINRFSGKFKAVIPTGTELQLAKEEVGDVKWLNGEELRKCIESDPKLTPYLRKWLKGFYFGDENNQH